MEHMEHIKLLSRDKTENLKKISLFIDKHLIPKYTDKQKNAEVSTPYPLRQDMLNTLPKSFWMNPKNTVSEVCAGKGGFVIDIIHRFMIGLKNKIKNSRERYKHIVENQIYFGDINKKNIQIIQFLIDPNHEYKLNSYEGDTLKIDIKKVWGIDSFDAVIGNPPYNINQDGQGNKPIYNLFIEKYIDICIYLLFVIPSRWFVAGKGLDKFRDFMLKRNDIEIIEHEDDSTKWFGKVVNIEGGVHYFLKNSKYHGKCRFNGIIYDLSKYDVIVKPEYFSFIEKFKDKPSLESIYKGRFFGIESNDKRLKKSGKILCYVSTLQNKNRKMYIDNYKMTKDNSFWKVFTPKANGNYPCFGYINIAKPNEIHTGSYISFKVNNKKEAESLVSYMKTHLVNFMLSIRKNTQNISGDTCKWIPLVPLNRKWDNKSVYKYFKLTPSEIKKIESKY